MLGIGETLHIRSDLCHQDMQDLLAHPIDLLATLDVLLKRAEMPFDLLFQVRDRTILRFNQGQ